MILTREQLRKIAPSISDKALEVFLPYLNKYRGSVDTAKRMAAFLGQVLHESGCFRYVHELASGEAYEGRADLGNTQKGDGPRFKGRGLIQVTGRSNYEKVSKALYGGQQLLETPDLLATPENAVRSAYWFWDTHNLNELADAGDYEKITRRINAGMNGWAERKMFYDRALKVFTEN